MERNVLVGQGDPTRDMTRISRVTQNQAGRVGSAGVLNVTDRVGSGLVWSFSNITGRVGSGQEIFISRGWGRVRRFSNPGVRSGQDI